jgi:hypothetical protein
MLLPFCLLLCARSQAQPGPFVVSQGQQLWFSAELLATNGLPGLSNSPLNLMLSSLASASAQGGGVALVSTQAWVRRYNGLATYPDMAARVAVDANGNVCVAGRSMGADLKYALVTMKYASDGTPLWTNYCHSVGPSDMFARGLGLDSGGNCYVSADSSPDGPSDTIKYAPNGTALWTNWFQVPQSTNCAALALAVDDSGNSYLLAAPGQDAPSQFVTVKLDPAGSPVWTNYYKNIANRSDYAVGLAVDKAGNVIVTGTSDGLGTGLNFAAIKYAPDGTGIWTNRYVGPGVDEIVQSLALDDDGNVIVSGDLMQSGEHLYVTVKYAANGVPLWTNMVQAPGYQGGNVPLVVTDRQGNVFLTGGSPGANGDDADFTVIKLSPNGVALWTNRFFEPNIGNPAPTGTRTDNAGNFYLAGSWNNGGTNDDYTTIKWSADGTPVWTHRYDGPAHSDDWAFDFVVDAAGHVYVTGGSEGAGTDFDFTTLKYTDFVSYTPPAGFFGDDSFLFTLTDSLGRSATGLVSVTVLPAQQLDMSASGLGLGPDGFRFRVLGAVGTNPVVVYATGGLSNWQPVLTNTPASGVVPFLDQAATNFPSRFYRAAQQQ